ncbi:hypothetical protein GRH90_18110 [Enterobacteriales bacterium SAP-6]|uniref:Uncharacterized protein n=1 Tax=Acerihabitans arboris TaxID=2691583 RepID=A0A845SHM6_9GAMM|nr:hypothetical protein [Acerihabitans arboris]NDL64653.1 hypothetical protein [Acerihabitans arboris]
MSRLSWASAGKFCSTHPVRVDDATRLADSWRQPVMALGSLMAELK